MRKTVKFLATLILSVFMMSNIASAASLVQMDMIMYFSQPPHGQGQISGNAASTLISLNGQKLRLTPSFQFSDKKIIGGSIKLLNTDTGQEILSLPLEKFPYFRAKKIAADTGEEFLLLQRGRVSVSDSVCSGLWIVGLHKGGYVSFVNIDAVQKAGLVFQDISSKLEDGELKLTGFARDRDCRIYDSTWRNTIGYQYKGHPAYPADPGNCEINSTYLFWDPQAQWFGIRQAD